TGIGAPLALVSGSTPVAVTAAHEHQFAERTRIDELAGLTQRPMKAMIEADPDLDVRALSRRQDRLDIGWMPSRRLLDQNVPAARGGSRRDLSQQVVRRGNDHNIAACPRQELAPIRKRNALCSQGCSRLRPLAINAPAGNELSTRHRAGASLANETTADDRHSRQGLSHLSPQEKPRSRPVMRRSL